MYDHESYLDNSATSRPSEEAIQAVDKALRNLWHNPSANYPPAIEVRHNMDAVRKICLHAAGADSDRIVFTSGGTEADHLAIVGYCSSVRKPGRVLFSAIEHPAVSACVEDIRRMGHIVEEIPVNIESKIDIRKLEYMLDEDVILIAVMHVNNETGAIQPLKEIADVRDRKCPEAVFHVDGVQGFMHVPFSFHSLRIQSYAFSGHKIQAVKGIGGLIIRNDHRVRCMLPGGGQEDDLRSGTENLPGILALGAAVAAYPEKANISMREKKLLLLSLLSEACPNIIVNGPPPEDGSLSAPHILNVSLPPVRSEVMVNALAEEHVYVSSGSACSSRKQKLSSVLRAMKIKRSDAESAIRFSLSPDTTETEIRYAAETVKKAYKYLSRYTRE